MLMEKIINFKKFITPTRLTLLIFAVYFLCGLLFFDNYGFSTDENAERDTSLANYAYVFEKQMSISKKESVRNTLNSAPELHEWKDRYYGVALQMIPMIYEHLRGFEADSREIFLFRHAFTFINYFIAAVFFYLILKRRFGKTYIPLIGVLFYILYPRFFGESFYNIKDILFFSWCVIASYFVLRWLEDEHKKAFLIPSAVTLAVATNTRVLGVSVLLLAGGFVFLQGLKNKSKLLSYTKKYSLLCVLTFISYIIITPFTWENPVKNAIDTFFHFTSFPNWFWTHFYLGEMISRDVPWHYIPVWMGITVPLLYIALFLIGLSVISVAGGKFIYKKIRAFKPMNKQDNQSLQEQTQAESFQLYDLFFSAMFVCTLLGFIVLGISMYEGWRHAYGIFLPFLYVAVYGLWQSYSFLHSKRKEFRIGFISIIALSLVHSLVWIIANHPYQYVYFNAIGKQVAEKNFALDYWHVSSKGLIKYVLAHDDRPVIKICTSFLVGYILTDEERERIIFTESDIADYYILQTRISYRERLQELESIDFEEYKSIIVDGIKIATLCKRNPLPYTVNIDFNVWDKITSFESNVNDQFHFAHDGNPDTRWSTERAQQPGDFMMFEFSETVEYNYIYLDKGQWINDYPRNLQISVSLDGEEWQVLPYDFKSYMHYAFESQPYRFLKLENMDAHEYNHWSVYNINFGYKE